MLWQGVSGAGNQLGVHDCRSKLVEEPFKTYDRLSRPSGPETIYYCNIGMLIISKPARRGIVLENVGALLSGQEGTRGLLAFIFKAT